ncbi:lysophospholipase L1-like esterase [Bradyrhizobium sp. GM24.11]
MAAQIRRSPVRYARVISLAVLWLIHPIAYAADLQVRLFVPPHSIVAFEGDSLTYGLDFSETKGKPPLNGSVHPRSVVPFPEEVGRLLSNRVVISNRGYPGDRSVDGIRRWRSAPAAALVFIMYGANDFANFGHRPGGIVDPISFKADLRELVLRRKSAGARVVLLTPPPLEDRDLDTRLEDYRRIVREVAKQEDTRIIETADLLRDVMSKWTDGLHLSAASNRALAAGLAAMIEISGQGAGSSQLMRRARTKPD